MNLREFEALASRVDEFALSLLHQDARKGLPSLASARVEEELPQRLAWQPNDELASESVFALAKETGRELEDAQRKFTKELEDLRMNQEAEMGGMFANQSSDVQLLVDSHIEAQQALGNKHKAIVSKLRSDFMARIKPLLQPVGEGQHGDWPFPQLEGKSRLKSRVMEVEPTPQSLGEYSASRWNRRNADEKTTPDVILGPWIGRVPASFRLLGFQDEKTGNARWGSLPVVASDTTQVQLGTSLKVSFRLSMLCIEHPFVSVFGSDVSFEDWKIHWNQVMYEKDVYSLLIPKSSRTELNSLSMVLGESPEVVFPMVDHADTSFHSSLQGFQVVHRSHTLQQGILALDELGFVSKVGIPLEAWGTLDKVTKALKAGLTECAYNRLSSGSLLKELALVSVSGGMSFQECEEWLGRVRRGIQASFEGH